MRALVLTLASTLFFAPATNAQSKALAQGRTETVKAKIVAACEKIAEGKSYTELSIARDRNLVAILKALRANKDWPQG